MKMSACIQATIGELDRMWPWPLLCRILNVDFYLKSTIDPDKVHTITEVDLQRVGVLPSLPLGDKQ